MPELMMCWRCGAPSSEKRPVGDFRIFLVERGSGAPARVQICGDCKAVFDGPALFEGAGPGRRRHRA